MKHVAFSPNGRWAASVGIDSRLHVFTVDRDGDHYTKGFEAETGPIRFSPDSRWLGLALLDSALVFDNGLTDGGQA